MDCNKTNCMECKFGGQSDGCHFDEESYNKALEDLLAKVKTNHYLLSDKINSIDYGMFTCGIEQIVDELKR